MSSLTTHITHRFPCSLYIKDFHNSLPFCHAVDTKIIKIRWSLYLFNGSKMKTVLFTHLQSENVKPWVKSALNPKAELMLPGGSASYCHTTGWTPLSLTSCQHESFPQLTRSKVLSYVLHKQAVRKKVLPSQCLSVPVFLHPSPVLTTILTLGFSIEGVASNR